MDTRQIHIGQQLKIIFKENQLTDKTITTLTPFDEIFLSKIYTSRDIQPRYLKNFLYVINKIFDLNLTTDHIYSKDILEA